MSMFTTKRARAAIAFALALTFTVPAMAQTPGRDADRCGWYIILGCFTNANAAFEQLAGFGGHGIGGGAGTNVLDTRFVGNFNPGYFCIADGPYVSQDDASSVAWVEAVPDAYVKRGC